MAEAAVSNFPFVERRAALTKDRIDRETEARRVETERLRLAKEVEAIFKHYLFSIGTNPMQAISRDYGFTINDRAFSVKVDVQPDLAYSYENTTRYLAPSKLPRQQKNLTAEELTDALLRIVHSDL